MTETRRAIHTGTLLFACLAVMTACDRSSAEAEHAADLGASDRLARAAQNLQQPLVIEGQPVETWSIDERMERYSVPGVSAAVIDDGRLVAAGAWGVTIAGGDEPVTTETIFQAGSVSKPVSAVLALSLVGDGALQLDEPINDVLRSWKVPDNELTRVAPVTLRHVLTHQAGFTTFTYLIPRSDASVPSMAELLSGGIRDWPVITVEVLPGSRHAYSNSGFCVLQLVLENASNLSLHELASQRMFGPLGMQHSTFAEPLDPAQLATAATGHTMGERPPYETVPVEGKAEIAPGATGGLWSTPSDLALLAVGVMQAWRGESDNVLATALAKEYLTPQTENMGLGIYLEGEGAALCARHGGEMVGFITHLVFYPNVGKGAVVMANGEGGRWVNQQLIAAIANEYDWPGFPVHRSLGTATLEQLRELVGVYSLDAKPDYTFTVRLEDGEAVGQIAEYSPFKLRPTSEPDLYLGPSDSLEILFRRAENGSVSKVTMRRSGDPGSNYSRRVDP